jgi:MFS family permease
MSEKINIEKGIFISALICIVAYLIVIISPIPALSLVGCGLCGIGSGILWPGSFSIASNRMPKGGVFMFGMLALAGDFGCLVGPSTAGLFNGNLRLGFLVALIFPITIMIISLVLFLNSKKKKA